jgi:hypothetical protein
LIKDDLINTKLIQSLQHIGLYSDCYYLHLSSTIFELLGFEDSEKTDEIFNRYIELTDKVVFVDILDGNSKMDELATLIYNELTVERMR